MKKDLKAANDYKQILNLKENDALESHSKLRKRTFSESKIQMDSSCNEQSFSKDGSQLKLFNPNQKSNLLDNIPKFGKKNSAYSMKDSDDESKNNKSVKGIEMMNMKKESNKLKLLNNQSKSFMEDNENENKNFNFNFNNDNEVEVDNEVFSKKESFKVDNRKLMKKEKICDTDTEDEGSDNEREARFIILPENFFKKKWDLLIAVVLIYNAIVLPYRVSFIDEDSEFNTNLDIVFDSIFGFDIIINFMSAYIDNEDNVIKSFPKISINYLKSWFFIDFFSILPIQNFITSNNSANKANFASLLRIARLPKLYRLVKLTKLFRMVKVVKKGNVNKITKYFLEKLKVNANIERLIYFILGFLILNHLSACFWYLIAKLQDFDPDCWVTRLGYLDSPPTEIYIISFYWTLTTVTTVGYGDINAGTTVERMYNLFIMSFGVLMYSFAIGSLSSIVSTLDAKTAEMNQKLQILSSIKSEFKLDQDIYDKVRKVIKYDLSRNQKDKMNFLQELPNKLRIELSKIMHDKLIEKLYFFRDQPSDFIAYVAPLLKPVKFTQNDYLYKISDMIDEMYFVAKGTISFSLSKEFLEKEIKEVKKNNNFGEIEMCLNEKLTYNIKVKSRNCELFVLKKNDFLRLSVNFKEFIEKFLQKSLMLYLRFNDERKRLMKEMENSKLVVNQEGDNKNEKNDLDKISEQEEDDQGNASEYDIYDHQDSKDGSSNGSSDHDNSKTSKKSYKNEIPKWNNNINERKNSLLDQSEHSKTNSKTKGKGLGNKSANFSDYNNTIVSNQNEANIRKKVNDSNKSMNKKRSLDSDRMSKSIKNIANPDEGIEELSANDINNVNMELTEHFEKKKNKINKTFMEKVDKIIAFLEEHKMEFSNGDDKNPLTLLKKLKDVTDINERNLLIDKIEKLVAEQFRMDKNNE